MTKSAPKPAPKPIINLAVERARRRPQSLRDRVRGGWTSTPAEQPRPRALPKGNAS